MAKGYRLVDREQEFLLPPAMNEWLPEDHLVWFVIAAVQRLDTAAFHGKAKLGGVGRQGYDPDMLLTLFVYAMAHGESSSRRIERLCETDVAFRIICASDVPDHTVLARFRRDHEKALTELLTQSLALAAELGMVSLGVVAFDGTKIAANASRDANRSEGYLRKLAEGFVSTVASADETEDVSFGQDNRGDELPPSVRDRTGRVERIDRALAQIADRRQAADQVRRDQAERVQRYEEASKQGRARRGRPPGQVDRVALTRARWERVRAEAEARYARAQGQRRVGRPPLPPDEGVRVRNARAAYDAARDEAEQMAQNGSRNVGPKTGYQVDPDGGSDLFHANLTDPDSRLLKTRNGWLQGYNCQLAASADGFIVSARATQDANDVGQFVPTMNDIAANVEELSARTGRGDLVVGTMVGDAGYDSEHNLSAEGPDRLIADGKRRHIDERAATDPATGEPPADASRREQMNHRLRTTEGYALYKRRAPLIEAPNAWLKDGRGLRRFARRGLDAAQAELTLACTVTNLLKLATKGVTASQLQNG